MRGKTWWIDGRFSRRKTCHFLYYFFNFFHRMAKPPFVWRVLLVGELRLGALTFRGGNLFFSLAHDSIGFVILLAIVAGLLPELLALLELLLGLGAVDLVGVKRTLGEDGHALGKDLHEAPGDEKFLIACRATMQPHFACSKLRQQRRCAVERLQVARHGRQFNRFHYRVNEVTIPRDRSP